MSAVAGFAFPSRPARADAVDAPPVGITPTTATLAQVFAARDGAVGKSAHPLVSEIVEGTLTEYGLSGTYRDCYRGADYRLSRTVGGITTQSGRLEGQRWRQNENGLTVLLRGVHQENEISARAYQRPDETGAVRLIGEVSLPFLAYIVEINPQGGRHRWLFFSKQSHLLERTESMYPEGRVTTTRSDFHVVNGETVPWHFHTSDGHPENDTDLQVSSDQVNVPVSASDLAIPGIARDIVEFPAGQTTVRLPARILEGEVIVRLNVNGRGLDFILDSGAGGIAFSDQVVRELGLSTRGRSIGTTAGQYQQSEATVPEIGIGTLRMHNIVVASLPFSQESGADTQAVGLLGFDFIAGAVIKVDYDHGTVDAIRADTFTPPADGLQTDAIIDDGVPFVEAKVNEATGDHFILDTGAFGVLLFSSFARAHPNDVPDVGRVSGRYVPELTSGGVGGTVPLSPVQLKHLRFASVDFKDFIAFVTRDRRAFEGEDEDGLIGQTFLRYFTIYLDYLNSRVVFEPGRELRKLMNH